MRDFQGSTGTFSYAVSEFLRVSMDPLPMKVFRREVPEVNNHSLTKSGLPVQVQILGGDPGRMAQSAFTACRAGATAIDINFGCPAPTVNRHDGGASLLKEPCRIREIVRAVRDAVPTEIPVSAKLRLGWDSIDAIHENAAMAAEGGADWLTIHARTRVQGYTPPVYWKPIGEVREALKIPIVANGDIWSIDDFRQCQDETGCIHFMIGRSALADPSIPYLVSRELGISNQDPPVMNWVELFRQFLAFVEPNDSGVPQRMVMRLKQWLKIASNFGDFRHFDDVKQAATIEEFFAALELSTSNQRPHRGQTPK
ncbi:MAG: tRNA-dihydrouridine synthase family protein, partial [Armatimonadota bacterium]